MKIAINSCWGGFSLSEKAAMLGRELSGDPLWAGIRFVGEKWDYGVTVDHFYGFTDIERDDPVLIKVIEQLGEEADGCVAALKIVEVPDDVLWEIDNYDGMESVHEQRRTWP